MKENDHGSDEFWEPAEPVAAELKIKRSLFIGHLAPCKSERDARAFLGKVKAEHRNATHNCWAYYLGDPETEHCSDDGEPSGTAGKPILHAVGRSGMVNLMVVVTRYFGGVKLGVRGLIDAYGQTAEDAVSKVRRVLRIRSRRLEICLPYSIIGEVVSLLETYGTPDPPTWKYDIDVEVWVDIRLSAAAKVTAALHELQAGNLVFSWSWFS